jgi:PBP1b-binding outer membrane lipoprotein LpoB
MKKLILIIPVFTIALIFTDCSKEGVNSSATPQSVKSNLTSPTATEKPPLRTYNVLTTYCEAPAQNCASTDVIIKPKFADAIRHMLTGNTAVVDYFNSEEWQDNFPDVVEDSILLNDLRSGNYYIQENVNASTGVDYYLAKNTSTNALRFAFPLVFE